MKYLAVIALLAAICVALSCRPRPERAERVEGQPTTSSMNEGAAGTGLEWFTSSGSSSAPSTERKTNPSTSLRAVSLSNGWWLAGFLAFGTAAGLYLLAWLGEGEG